MPSPPAGKVYQVWVISSAGARSAGLLPAATAGRTEPLLADGISPGDQIGITVEPAGGTTHPTTTPLAVIAGA
jgi:anti-sigma-K factor RskA